MRDDKEAPKAVGDVRSSRPSLLFPLKMSRLNLPNVREVEERAAETYGADPALERFDPSRSLIWRPHWDEAYAALALRREQSLATRIDRGEPGYQTYDQALFGGAAGAISQLGYSIASPDREGNEWGKPAPQTQMGGWLKVHSPSGPASQWAGDPSRSASAVKKAARLYGADVAGVAPLDRRWVYRRWYDPASHAAHPIRFSDEPESGEAGTLTIPSSIRYAVVVGVAMDLGTLRSAPTLREMSVSILSYAKVTSLVVMLAGFIRTLGYRAIPSINCTALNVPLAIDAGLGELGRNGKLITPRFGPRVRLAKVLTDMPLKPDRCISFGVLDFCNHCRRCAYECPARAIPTGDRSSEPACDCNQRGVVQYQVDHGRCFTYLSGAGTDCGICLAVCPYNRGVGWTQSVASLSCGDESSSDLDRVFGYGREADPDDFWND